MTQGTIRLSKTLKALRDDYRDNKTMLATALDNQEYILYKRLEKINETILESIKTLSRKYTAALITEK